MLVRTPQSIKFERNGKRMSATLDPSAPTRYPYVGSIMAKYLMPHGVVVPSSLSAQDFDTIGQELLERDARSAWVICSRIMRPAVEDLLRKRLPEECLERLRLVVPSNDFLGGNIRIMDMCTVSDFHSALLKEVSSAPAPDVIFLPSMPFNPMGRDIAGRHYSELSRALDIPVVLLSSTSRFPF